MSAIRRNSLGGRLAIIAILGLLAGTAVPARASFIVYMFNDGSGNVVAGGSGTINTAGLSFSNSATANPVFIPFIGILYTGGTISSNPVDRFTGITTPGLLGTLGPFAPSSATGDLVGADSSNFLLPSGYVSGAPLSNSTTWAGQTIDGMGLTVGTYEWTWGSGSTADSFTLDISEVAPEPASIFMLLFGAGALGFACLRRRKKLIQSI